jgi:galactosylceramidase
MTQTNSTFFENLAPIAVVNGQFSITVNPDEIYTITTLSSGNKASIPTPPPSQPFPSIYSDDFEGYNVSSEARYFADQAGEHRYSGRMHDILLI